MAWMGIPLRRRPRVIRCVDTLLPAFDLCKENEERLKRKKLSQDGIEVESDEVDDLEPVDCGKCGATWSPTQTYCGECGWTLDKETARQQKEIREAGEDVVRAKMDDLTEEEVQEKKKEVLSKMEEM